MSYLILTFSDLFSIAIGMNHEHWSSDKEKKKVAKKEKKFVMIPDLVIYKSLPFYYPFFIEKKENIYI